MQPAGRATRSRRRQRKSARRATIPGRIDKARKVVVGRKYLQLKEIVLIGAAEEICHSWPLFAGVAFSLIAYITVSTKTV